MHTFNISQLPSTLQLYSITKVTSSRNSQMQEFTISKIVTNSKYAQDYKIFQMHRKNKSRKSHNHPIHQITKMQVWIIYSIHKWWFSQSHISQLHNIIETTNLTNSHNLEFQNIHKVAELESCTNSHLHQFHKLHKTTFLQQHYKHSFMDLTNAWVRNIQSI